MANASRDNNYVPTLLGISSVDGTTPVPIKVNPVTGAIKIDLAGAGTVTDVSVVTANGFAGTVATSTTTPAITIQTTITGIIKGDGTAISAAVADTDYLTPGTAASTYSPIAGSSNIVTVGTITSGTWNGSIISVAYGGTGRASHTAYAVICGGTTTTGAQQSVASVGTSGQVLTSNGAGSLPTFQDAAAGGGASIFDATAGASGADYTSVRAAILDGKSRILVIDNTTEPSDINLPANGVVEGINSTVTIDLGTGNRFNMGDDCIVRNVKITGSKSSQVIVVGNNGLFYNCTFEYTRTSDTASAAGFIDDSAVAKTNNKIINCTFDIGVSVNVDFDNFRAIYSRSSTSYGLQIRGCIFNGNSTSYRRQAFWINSNNALVKDVILYNMGDSSGSLTLVSSDYVVVDGLSTRNCQGALEWDSTTDYCTITNIVTDNTSVTLDCYNDNGSMSACDIRGGVSFRGTFTNVSSCYFGNLTLASTCNNGNFTSCFLNSILDNTSNTDIKFSSCYVNNAITLDGDRFYFGSCLFSSNVTLGSNSTFNSFVGCNIRGNMTISGDDNSFTGGKVGSDAGGGSNTISINVGSDRTIIGDTRTDAAISDSGTGSSLSNNVVY